MRQAQEKASLAGLAVGREHEAGAGQRRLSLQGEQAGSNVRIQVSVKRSNGGVKTQERQAYIQAADVYVDAVDASTAQQRAVYRPKHSFRISFVYGV